MKVLFLIGMQIFQSLLFSKKYQDTPIMKDSEAGYVDGKPFEFRFLILEFHFLIEFYIKQHS